MGVRKPGTGLRFADVLIIEEGEIAQGSPRVETMSFKSRDFSRMEGESVKNQMIEDANEALLKYGETLDIRRDSLRTILRQGREVSVQRVRLIYQGGSLLPKIKKVYTQALNETKAKVPGVEVLFE